MTSKTIISIEHLTKQYDLGMVGMRMHPNYIKK